MEWSYEGLLHIASDSVDIDMFGINRYWQLDFISIILEIDPEELYCIQRSMDFGPAARTASQCYVQV